MEIAEGPPLPNRSAGAALVQTLIESKQVVFLKGVDGKGQDKSTTSPVSVDDAVDNIPTDASVSIDMREDSKTQLLVKGEKRTELEQPSVAVKTAHELSHADTLTSGTLQNGATTRSYVDEQGKQRQEQIKHDEVKAIHRENQIRRERGLREREAYTHR